jgi:nucleotide-binding universal stress UspA family protein
MPIEPSGPVVVGVDGSPASMAAVDIAAEEATGRVVPLVIVHAVGRGQERSERVLEHAVSRAYADHPGMSVSAEFATGEPADVLVGRATGACLLVVGHSRSGVLAGSVAQQVAQRATVPVLVQRALDTTAPTVDEPWPVVACLAGRPGDDEIVQFAFAEAALRGAPLRAVHIWTMADALAAAAGGFVPARDAADRTLVDALAAWSEKYPEVRVHRVVRQGIDVPVAVTAASRSAQLIVVGSSRRDGVPRSWVVETVVHRAACGVAVVPT